MYIEEYSRCFRYYSRGHVSGTVGLACLKRRQGGITTSDLTGAVISVTLRVLKDSSHGGGGERNNDSGLHLDKDDGENGGRQEDDIS